MRIVVLGARGFPGVQGGVEKHAEELYVRLAALGEEIIVLGRAPYVGKDVYEYRGVTVAPLPCPRHKFWEAPLHTLAGVLKARTLKPDIVHFHAIGPSLFVPLARLLGLKVVMTHHGADYQRKKWNKFAKAILKLGEQWGATFSHRVISVSRAIALALQQTYGRDSVFIPNGVKVQERISGNGTLKELGLERGRYVLAVGRLVPEKGFDDLLESFQRTLLSERGDWKLVIVGDADHQDRYSQALKVKARQSARVVLAGFRRDRALQELYSHCALFVLPSYHEGLPIALLEALSYGSSCLASDIQANKEVGLEEDRYFKAGHIECMSEKIARYLQQSLTDEGRNALIQRVKSDHDWDRIALKTQEIYVQVLGQ